MSKGVGLGEHRDTRKDREIWSSSEELVDRTAVKS